MAAATKCLSQTHRRPVLKRPSQESKLIDFWDTADFYRHPTIVIPDIYNLNQVQEEEEEEEEEEKEGEGWSSALF